jgi:hypothetical protein
LRRRFNHFKREMNGEGRAHRDGGDGPRGFA